jgi:hypothetical protein
MIPLYKYLIKIENNSFKIKIILNKICYKSLEK